MTVVTTKPDLFVGTVTHPLGTVLELDDDFARLLVGAKVASPYSPAPPAIESASLASAPESADLTPRAKGRERRD